MDAEEKLHIALARVMTRKDLKLFGCISYKFDINLVDDIEGKNKTAVCYISKATKKPTIEFCKEFVKELTISELIFVILHEMIHFIDGHLNSVRYSGKDPEIFNLAADHIINSMLEEDSKGALQKFLSAPKSTFLVSFFIGKKCTLIEVYEWLMNNTNRIKIIVNPGTGQAEISINDRIAGTINLDLKPSPNSTTNSEDITNELKNDLRSIIDNVLEQGGTRGNSSSKIYEYIKEITKLEIPWTILLENAIESVLSKSNQNRSWRQLRKRLRIYNILLPDSDKDFILDTLYILQDTSGSVGTSDQEKFSNIIEQSINFFQRIIILQHDSRITNTLEISVENFHLYKSKIFEIYGRGGTKHTDCFKYIEKQFFEEDEKIGLIIILSDFESNIEDIWNNYKFHEYINVKVLCTKNNTIPLYVDSNPIYIKSLESK